MIGVARYRSMGDVHLDLQNWSPSKQQVSATTGEEEARALLRGRTTLRGSARWSSCRAIGEERHNEESGSSEDAAEGEHKRSENWSRSLIELLRWNNAGEDSRHVDSLQRAGAVSSSKPAPSSTRSSAEARQANARQGLASELDRPAPANADNGTGERRPAQQTMDTAGRPVDVSPLRQPAVVRRPKSAAGVASSTDVDLGRELSTDQSARRAAQERRSVEGDNMASHEPRATKSYMRLALLHPCTSSGSYKVAQQQQVSISASGEPNGRQRRHVGPARMAPSRLSRSPLSLQRQTSARLARHRLKIQQQRQEQLLELALNNHLQRDRKAGQATQSRRYQLGQPAPSQPEPSSHQSQPAGSSGSQESRPSSVIVYKSINMQCSEQQDERLIGATSDRLSRAWLDGAPEAAADTQTIRSAGSTASLNRPFCKICHVGASKDGDRLISPCKCSGTMQYIHCGCLLKWLEISNRSNEKPISCELCAHEYTWHKRFNYNYLRLPNCSPKDVILHTIFVLALGLMLFSAAAPMLRRRSGASPLSGDPQLPAHLPLANRFPPVASLSAAGHPEAGRLAHDEKFMLLCAASFFISFFVAIYVQTKARDTLYGLVVKFLTMNQTYYITEYDHGQLQAKHQQQPEEPASDQLRRAGSNQKAGATFKGHH